MLVNYMGESILSRTVVLIFMKKMFNFAAYFLEA